MEKINPILIDCLNRNSLPNEKLGNMLKAVVERSDVKDFTIPVLGTQGMGKSTLINALLKEDILPNDADETTCVPVEVSYGEKEYGEVFFLDGKKSIEVNTREELSKFVDNNENPANELRVDRIRLYRKAEILKGGLTLVDLPGVGSVTLENEKTTKQYIQNQCIALFVIPTVPTIRGTEALFIQGSWAQFAGAMFVQNHWGETKLEVKDSVEHNTKVLKQISDKIGSKLEGSIMVVNAYKAVKGEIDHDKKLIETSNIAVLQERIKDFSNNWEKKIKEGLKSRTEDTIILALKVINNKLAELDLSVNQAREQRQKVYDDFRKQNDSILSSINNILRWLREKNEESSAYIKELAKKEAGSIRAEITRIIRNGVIDGSKLEEAFNDVQTEYCERFFDDVLTYLKAINIEFESKMDGLAEAIHLQNDMEYKTVSHATESKLKWEKLLEPAFGIGGGLLGIALFSNPFGWVALGVGAAISAVCAIFAAFLKKSKQKARMAEAEREISPKIKEVEEKLWKVTCEKNNEFFSKASNFLKDMKIKQMDKERELYNAIDEVDLNPENRDNLIKDKFYLEQYLNTI